MNLKTGLLAGACVILAVVAAIGWTHGRTGQNVNQAAYGQPASIQPGYVQPANSQPADYNAANPAYPNTAPPYPNSAPPYQPGNPPYVTSQNPAPYDNGPAYQGGVYYPDTQYEPYIHRPVVVRPAEEPPPPAYAPGYSESRGREYREIHHGRSTGKSVAIVAGSAGVGAAVGALAGGGKGAGIGALAGGAGGFVYDRLTHNH
jgi:type IV secretory pathway VirB10-like protein